MVPVKASGTDYDTEWRSPIDLFGGLIATIRPTSGTGSLVIGTTSTSAGTASSPAQSTSTVWETLPRIRQTAVASTGQSASRRTGLVVACGGSGFPGYRVRALFGFSAFAAGKRCFVGLQGSAGAIGNVEPDTLFSMVAVIARSSDTNLQLASRRAGTTDYYDLGSDFPVGLLNVPLLLELDAEPGSGVIQARVTRQDTGASFSQSISGANSPGENTMLAFHTWINTASTSTAGIIDLALFDAWRY